MQETLGVRWHCPE